MKNWDGKVRQQRDGASFAQTLTEHYADPGRQKGQCQPADNLVSMQGNGNEGVYLAE